MAKAASKSKRLIVQGGEIGLFGRQHSGGAGNFESFTNFSMEISYAVSSPKGVQPCLFGYVFCVATTTGTTR